MAAAAAAMPTEGSTFCRASNVKRRIRRLAPGLATILFGCCRRDGCGLLPPAALAAEAGRTSGPRHRRPSSPAAPSSFAVPPRFQFEGGHASSTRSTSSVPRAAAKRRKGAPDGGAEPHEEGPADRDRALRVLLSELKTLPWTNRQDVKVTLTKYDEGEEALREALESSPALVRVLCEHGGENGAEAPPRRRGGEGEKGGGESSERRKKPSPPAGLVSGLVDRVGSVSRSVMVEMISRHPDLMARVLTDQDGLRTKESRIASDLDLTEPELAKITRTLGREQFKRLNRTKIREVICYFRRDVRLTEDQLKKMILLRPQLLLYSVSNLSGKVRFFREDLGMSQEEFVRMIRTVPLVLAYSVENRLRPTVEFLRTEIGSSKWKWIAYRYPQIFSYSLDNTLRPKCQFFMEKLQLSQPSDISQVASNFPPTLWLPEDTILSKVSFLRQELDLNKEELRDVLVTFPQVLGLSLEENLRPTVEFLLGTGGDPGDGAGLTRQKLKEFVLYQPALLAYSLENRLRPRIRRMQESDICFSYAPPNIMSKTDDKFNEWFESQTKTWTVSE